MLKPKLAYYHAVGDHFNVSRITISRLIIRFRKTGRTKNRSRNGRPRVASQRQDRHLRLNHLRNRMTRTEDTARRTPGLANVSISGQTVHRRLRNSGFRARRPVVGPILKQRHRTARLAWAHAHRRWRLHTLQHILFSHESRFSLRFSDGRYCVYRRRRERFTDQSVYETDRFGCAIVLARICHDGRTQLKVVQGTLNAVKYREDILHPIVLSFLQQRNFDHAFQHDNAKSHVARVFQDFLIQNHIRVLSWPALSPDLSPIELLWDELGRGFRHRQMPPETVQKLHDTLVHEWNNIPQAFIQRLIGSICRRCESLCRCCKRWSHTLLNLHTACNFCRSMICSDNDVEKFG